MSIFAAMPTDLQDRISGADAASASATSDDAELERLAALSPLDYDRQRAAAAKRLACRASTLDAEVGRFRPRAEALAAGKGSPLTLDRPNPWPESVDCASLLSDIAEVVTRYVVLPPAAADAVALWVLHAYAHDAADHSPLLAITSPEKRCGKTTLLQVVTALVPAPLATSNISPAAIYRTIEACQPTLLIDEADTFLRSDDDILRGVLNSGHSRTSAYVIRTVGEDHEPARFPTWAPKAIACIGKLPGTLTDRSVEIRLQRAMPGAKPKRYLPRRVADQMASLCSRAARWAADHLNGLTDADPRLPDVLHDRAQDNWRPLIAIADAAGGEWPDRARRAALALSGAHAPDEQSIGTTLLFDIRDIFRARGCDRLASCELAAALGELEHRPWADCKGKAITPAKVARLLKPFAIEPRLRKVQGRPDRGYDRTQFTDAWSRYLGDGEAATAGISVTPVTALQWQHFSRAEGVTAVEAVTDQDRQEAQHLQRGNGRNGSAAGDPEIARPPCCLPAVGLVPPPELDPRPTPDAQKWPQASAARVARIVGDL